MRKTSNCSTICSRSPAAADATRRRWPSPGDEQRRRYRADPRARKINHLRDNAAAADITLSPEDILTIDHIFAAENVAGLRYNRGDFNLIDK